MNQPTRKCFFLVRSASLGQTGTVFSVKPPKKLPYFSKVCIEDEACEERRAKIPGVITPRG